MQCRWLHEGGREVVYFYTSHVVLNYKMAGMGYQDCTIANFFGDGQCGLNHRLSLIFQKDKLDRWLLKVDQTSIILENDFDAHTLTYDASMQGDEDDRNTIFLSFVSRKIKKRKPEFFFTPMKWLKISRTAQPGYFSACFWQRSLLFFLNRKISDTGEGVFNVVPFRNNGTSLGCLFRFSPTVRLFKLLEDVGCISQLPEEQIVGKLFTFNHRYFIRTSGRKKPIFPFNGRFEYVDVETFHRDYLHVSAQSVPDSLELSESDSCFCTFPKSWKCRS